MVFGSSHYTFAESEGKGSEEVKNRWGVNKEELAKFVTDRDSGSLESTFKEWGELNGLKKMLKTNWEDGLKDDPNEIAERKRDFGENVLPEKEPESFWSFWFAALKDKTLIILMIAAVISIVLGVSVDSPEEPRELGWIDGTAILIAVMLVSGVTALNDWTKDKKFRQLSKISEDRQTKVIRGGVQKVVRQEEVVIGDVVYLETGDYIPADLIYITGQNITADESPMTGEPENISKNEEDPFFLSGCMIMEGVGKGVVVAVGELSQWGKIKKSLEKEETKTPLQEKLEDMAEFIGKCGLVAAAITFVALILRWTIDDYGVKQLTWEWAHLNKLIDAVITAITIIVVAVPEGLPLAVTLSLAYSMMKMMKDQNLVRHLAACETMGGATNICSDKTGTLTQNRMTVTKMWIGNEKYDDVPKPTGINDKLLHLFNEGMCINSSAYLVDKGDKIEFVGAKTECALLVLADKLGEKYDKVRKEIKPVRIFPFSSKKKSMTTIIKNSDGGYRSYTKGASEVILERCVKVLDEEGNEKDLSSKTKKKLLSLIQTWASDGLRTLSLTHKDLPANAPVEDKNFECDDELTLVGLVGIEDPVRDEVPDAVRECQGAGITVRMVTGDNILTAKNIGKKCGILTDDGVAIEGPEFRKLSEEELDKLIPKLQIIARCSPEDKLVLVKRLRHHGEVVAVTGDGTNDSPALTEADVGFAMGISGTEVAKHASDIILLDDNFSSIEKAVMWGRNVYDSIRKFVQFQLTVNVVAVFCAFIGAVSTGESPLKPVQLLWVNLIMDTMAALALATEAPTRDLMNRPPYGRYGNLITNRMWRFIITHSALQLAVVLFLLFGAYHIDFLECTDPIENPHDKTRDTLIFNTFVFLQIFNEFNARKLADEKNPFQHLTKNWIFIGIFIFTVIVQILLVNFGGEGYALFMGTTPLDIYQWIFCVVVGLLSFPVGFLSRFVPVPKEKTFTKEEIEELRKKDKTLNKQKRKSKDSGNESDIELGEMGEDDDNANQNWALASQVLTQVHVISAFRRASHGVKY